MRRRFVVAALAVMLLAGNRPRGKCRNPNAGASKRPGPRSEALLLIDDRSTIPAEPFRDDKADSPTAIASPDRPLTV